MEEHLIEVNDSYKNMMGYSEDELRKLTYKDITPEKWHASEQIILTEQILKRGYSDPYEKELIRKDGTIFPVELRAYLIKDAQGNNAGMRAIVTDITDRKKAEKEKISLQNQLQQAHKMESIGTLTGGIAHDFNNILSIMIGNTELAMDDVPEWNPVRNNLEEVKIAGLRAKDVVQQLLSFSRKSDQKQKPVKICPIIKDSLKFLRSTIPTNIEILGNIPDEPCIISADPTQINQVMMNLCTNASHAMSENGGIMDIRLSIIDIDKDEAIQDVELNQGQYIKITVSDTGQGIDREHLDRIFDPYFTTKEVGEGSGIGLSVVHGIVKSHNGAISVDSEYGKGTTFSVFFPVVEIEPAYEEKTDTTIPTGNERILFVDDDNSIANMTGQMLKRLGYIVTIRNSSTDTLKTFRTRPDNFDLIISDISMPEITGDKLAMELQKIRPEIPIILCTGNSERVNDAKAKSIGVKALVMKPIVKSVLAKTIRKVLDGNE
jgi:PAS domain S-box-containing protein